MIAQIWHVNGCPSPDPFHAGVLGDILLLKIYMVGPLLGQVKAIYALVATRFPMGCHTNQWVVQEEFGNILPLKHTLAAPF